MREGTGVGGHAADRMVNARMRWGAGVSSIGRRLAPIFTLMIVWSTGWNRDQLDEDSFDLSYLYLYIL